MRKSAPLSWRLYIILNAMMVLIYAFCAVALFLWESSTVSRQTRLLFSGVLLLYSIFRGFTLLRKIQKPGNEN
jgi:hypothetical protein